MSMLVSLDNRRMLCKTSDPFVIVFSSIFHFCTKINECSRFMFQMNCWFWMKTELDQKIARQKGPRFTIRFYYMTTCSNTSWYQRIPRCMSGDSKLAKYIKR
jgi:hypothetical protein